MNQLARREVAIVSPHAGTTRDIIEVHLDLAGYPVTVIDTAGIRETDDPVEQEGVRRARTRAAEADLVLWLVVEGSLAPELGGQVPVWTVRNKSDLDALNPYTVVLQIVAAGLAGKREIRREERQAQFAISARDGNGVDQLIEALIGFAEEFFGNGDDSVIGRERHRELLRLTAGYLRRSLDAVEDGDELVAEHLRSAIMELGRLLGTVDVEEILGVVFAEFCIGK